MRLLAVAAFVMLAGSVEAKEAHCMARIISDVPAEEAPEQVKSKSNGDFGPIDLIKVNKKTGKMTYCTKDSYCYVSNAFELITPCRIKRDTSVDDASFYMFFTR